MKTFHAPNGTISPSDSALGIVIESIQADVADTSVTDVVVTATGSEGTGPFSWSGITPVLSKYTFLPGEDVVITSAGSIDNVILNYVEAGASRENRIAAELQYTASGIPSTQKWTDVISSGTYSTDGYGG